MKRYYAIHNLVCNPEHFIGAGLCHRQKEGWQLAHTSSERLEVLEVSNPNEG